MPLSLPTDAAKSAGRGLSMIGVMMVAFGAGGTGLVGLVARLVLVAGNGRNLGGRRYLLRFAGGSGQGPLAGKRMKCLAQPGSFIVGWVEHESPRQMCVTRTSPEQYEA